MVVTTILACFLNNMFNLRYFSFKIWIRNPYSSSKIIQIFILLSDLRVSISSVIFGGEQSFNPTSTASRLMFAHPPSFLRPPQLRHRISPPTTPNNPDASPSPLLRDVGSTNATSASSQVRTQPRPPLPEWYLPLLS
jgi:hypothetical protein